MKRLRLLLPAFAFVATAVSCIQQSGSEFVEAAHEAYRQRAATKPFCESWVYEPSPSAFVFPTPSPVPFPTPAGGTVKPKEKDLPVFPGAELLDSFVREDGEERTVQLYRTTASSSEVFTYFDRELVAGDWARGGGGFGVAGVTCSWGPWIPDRGVPLPEKRYIQVTTEYVGREKRDPTTHSPGFQGKAVRFAEPEPGYTWFWVITPR